MVRMVKQLASYSTATAGVIGLTANNTVQLGTPVASPAGNAMYDIPFSVIGRIDEVAAYTELTNLFDQFKITFIKCKVTSSFNAGTSLTIPTPYIDYQSDHDDGVPVAPSVFRERMGVKTRYFSASRPSISMSCKPKVRLAGGLTAAGSVAANLVPGVTWVNTAWPETEHYSIKGILRNVYLPASANTSVLTWDVSLGVALKDVQ